MNHKNQKKYTWKYVEQIPESERDFYYEMEQTRLKNIYYCMLTRCYNKNHRSYRNYGARGIKICDEWLGACGKIDFYKWAISHGYKDGLTIDRIDVNGNYEPSNCRWLNYTEQNNNKRVTIKILYNDKIVTLKELSKITGIEYHTLYKRYRKGIGDFSDLVPQA